MQIESRISIKQRLRKNLVLRTIKENSEPIAIVDIAKKNHFNYPTTAGIISELVKKKIVINLGNGVTSQGRSAELYKLNPDYCYFVGIDFGKTRIHFVVVNIDSQIIGEKNIRTENVLSTTDRIKTLIDETTGFINDIGLDFTKIHGISLILNGNIEIIPREYFQMELDELKTTMTKLFEVTVEIENDSKVTIDAEKWFGLAKDIDSFICIIFGWGIGMGIFLNGKSYYGAHGNAGEIGHIQVVDNGELCYCGKRGCLETVASGHIIIERAKEVLKNKNKENSFILKLVNGNTSDIDEEIIVKAAIEGDIFAIELIEEAATVLGKEIANLIKIFDPSVVIINGAFASTDHFILNPIQTIVDKLTLYYVTKRAKIMTSKLGNKAAALGGTAIFLNRFFDVQNDKISKYI